MISPNELKILHMVSKRGQGGLYHHRHFAVTKHTNTPWTRNMFGSSTALLNKRVDPHYWGVGQEVHLTKGKKEKKKEKEKKKKNKGREGPQTLSSIRNKICMQSLLTWINQKTMEVPTTRSILQQKSRIGFSICINKS